MCFANIISLMSASPVFAISKISCSFYVLCGIMSFVCAFRICKSWATILKIHPDFTPESPSDFDIASFCDIKVCNCATLMCCSCAFRISKSRTAFKCTIYLISEVRAKKKILKYTIIIVKCFKKIHNILNKFIKFTILQVNFHIS